MERKYRTLRFIASLLKVIGIIVGVLALLSSLAICATSVLGGAALERGMWDYSQRTFGLGIFTGLIGGILAALIPIIFGGIQALVLFGVGEAIYVQIDIEENTRLTGQAITRMLATSEGPARQPAAPPAVAMAQPQAST